MIAPGRTQRGRYFCECIDCIGSARTTDDDNKARLVNSRWPVGEEVGGAGNMSDGMDEQWSRQMARHLDETLYPQQIWSEGVLQGNDGFLDCCLSMGSVAASP